MKNVRPQKNIYLATFLFLFAQTAFADLSGHYFFTPQATGFNITSEQDLFLTPECIKAKGMSLVILDPGHDDTDASRRSDAKDRGGSKYYFKWPEVHEGQANMVSSYLALEYALAHPSLSVNQKRELRTMIRFSRHPGEKTFGDYEALSGYGVRGGCSITSGVTNRPERVTAMAKSHRPFDPATGKFSTTQKLDVTSKSLMISVHGNSTTYWDEGDLIWLIPPKANADTLLMNKLKEGFSASFLNFYTIKSTDDSQTVSLKNGARSSANLDRIKLSTHPDSLAMLGSRVAMTRKVLLEGYVMNAKAGHLAYRDIKEVAPREKLDFLRSGVKVASYDVSETYMTYAKSIIRGLNKYFACGSR